ncbi:MAG: hypothetical protein AAF376_12835 [Pseudomonadota bacterium]
MTGADIFRLILLILVIAVWAMLTWGVHKKLHARAEAEGNSASDQFGIWWKGAEDRKERNTFLFLTVAILIMAALQIAT